MQVLKFNVRGQEIALDQSCSAATLIPGTEGYVQVEFTFSSDWDGCTKVVAFYSNLGKEYEPRPLNDGKVCTIPTEALKNSIIKLQVLGQKAGYYIRTNRIAIHQKGGSI